MKYLMLTLSLILSFSVYGQTLITTEDIESIEGNWEGTITYIDYQTNKPFTMASNLTVEKGRKDNTWVLSYDYPDEPKANSSEKLKVSKNGTVLNKHLVAERNELENGLIMIRTEHKGKDDHKKARIRLTYLIGNDMFTMRKEVLFIGGEEWIKRSEYSYQRK